MKQDVGATCAKDIEGMVHLHNIKVRRAITSYFDTHSLCSHQLESFEHFVTKQIEEITLESNPLLVSVPKQHLTHRIIFSRVRIQRPQVTESQGNARTLSPEEACRRKLTYALSVYVDVHHKVYKRHKDDQRGHYVLNSSTLFKNVLFFQVPCMVNTTACNNWFRPYRNSQDAGCFVINGYRKVMITQERLRTNFPYVFDENKNSRYTHKCQIRSYHLSKIRSTSTLNIYISGSKTGSVPEVFLVLPFISAHIPLVVIFRVLGFQSSMDIFDVVLGTLSKTISPSILFRIKSILTTDNTPTYKMSSEELLDWIGCLGSVEKTRQKRIKYVRHIFRNELLPHCGEDYSTVESQKEMNLRKAYFLGFSVRKLLMVALRVVPPDDIDSYTNKRACSAGDLFALMTRQIVRNYIKNLRLQVFKASTPNQRYMNLSEMMNHKKITNLLKYACATGNWGIQRASNSSNQTGVCQVLNTMNLSSRLSHYRLVNTPVNRDGKIPKPRQLHPSHYGILCPADTPEGKSVGLLKSLCRLSRIRVGYAPAPIIRILQEELGVLPFMKCSRKQLKHSCLVLVNGSMVGCVADPDKLVMNYKKYRSHRDVPIDSSITYKREMGEIYVQLDKGDCYRPLFQLSRLHLFETLYQKYSEYPHLFWESLLSSGVIEYISKEEETTLYIATDYETFLRNPQRPFTHMDLIPSEMFGVAASIIPFSNRNQAPRNIYQSSMGKQSISTRPVDFSEKADSKVHVLDYAQKPLVTTVSAETMELDKDPAGQVAIVAICCYTGFNQEDSVILNKASVDRGLFGSSFHRVVRASEFNRGGENVTIDTMPEDAIGRKKSSASKLDKDGIIKKASVVEKGDVLVSKINRYTRLKRASDGTMKRQNVSRDRSHVVDWDEKGVVGNIEIQPSTRGDMKNVLIRIDSERTPEIGDKFSSRHGQKGICGMLLPQEDMPFTRDGIVPDLIMNVHALPSRMTIGQLFESLLGKVCCMKGRIGNGTPFQNVSMEDIERECRKFKISNMGKEVMYSGTTGEMMDKPVFITPVYYQRLKHMVADKIHARSTGAVQFLTRQPLEGRSKKGGFRMGEMERDALISHGVSENILDRLLRQSDSYKTVICTKCKHLAEPETNQQGLSQNLKRSNVVFRPAFCRFCKSSENIANIQLPYPAKLLLQELQGCGIDMTMDWE